MISTWIRRERKKKQKKKKLNEDENQEDIHRTRFNGNNLYSKYIWNIISSLGTVVRALCSSIDTDPFIFMDVDRQTDHLTIK